MRSLKSPQKVPGASEANFSRIYAREVGGPERIRGCARAPASAGGVGRGGSLGLGLA